MNRFVYAAVALVICMGCRPDGKPDWRDLQIQAIPAYQDLEQTRPYWEQVQALSAGPLRRSTVTELDRIARQELLPRHTHAVKVLEGIHPRTQEVQQAHAYFLASLRSYQSGVQLLISSIPALDEAKANQSTSQLKEATRQMGLFKVAATALEKKYGRVTATPQEMPH